jgi:hypothetical protein
MVVIEFAFEPEIEIVHPTEIVKLNPTFPLRPDSVIKPKFRNEGSGAALSRTILGELRAAEAFDLLQAVNTGGTLSTIDASSAAQAGYCAVHHLRVDVRDRLAVPRSPRPSGSRFRSTGAAGRDAVQGYPDGRVENLLHIPAEMIDDRVRQAGLCLFIERVLQFVAPEAG